MLFITAAIDIAAAPTASSSTIVVVAAAFLIALLLVAASFVEQTLIYFESGLEQVSQSIFPHKQILNVFLVFRRPHVVEHSTGLPGLQSGLR